MATFNEILEAVRSEQDVIVASINATQQLVAEVQQLLAVNNIPDAQALLDTINANAQALSDAIVQNTAVKDAVDAANG